MLVWKNFDPKKILFQKKILVQKRQKILVKKIWSKKILSKKIVVQTKSKLHSFSKLNTSKLFLVFLLFPQLFIYASLSSTMQLNMLLEFNSTFLI